MKSTLALLIALSFTAPAFANNFNFKVDKTANLPKGLVEIKDITYKGHPVLTESPRDSIVKSLLWKLREDAFKQNDTALINSTDRAIAQSNGFDQNYASLCKSLGFRAMKGGQGEKIAPDSLTAPTKVASMQDSRISIIAISSADLEGTELSIVSNLVCSK